MPKNNYLKIKIGGEEADVSATEELPIKITYQLEDSKDFTRKKGSNALSIKFPANRQNSKVANSLHNVSIEDLTSGQLYKGVRPAIIEVAGQELLVGKAFLKNAKHTSVPTGYEYDFYGNNSDWMIDLKETTFYDCMKHLQLTFSKQKIIDSWQFDGTDEALPYVFAPVRYAAEFEEGTDSAGNKAQNYNMLPGYFKPAMSKYWVLFWGFKIAGYRMESQFFNTAYFKRQVMPWTFGGFLSSEGSKLDALKFLAKSHAQVGFFSDTDAYIHTAADNDFSGGAYDNSNTYDYINNVEMRWSYPTALQFGNLDAMFHMNLYLQSSAWSGSVVEVFIDWFKNGVQVGTRKSLMRLDGPFLGRKDFISNVEDWKMINVSPGDVVSAKIYLHLFESMTGRANLLLSVDAFNIDYFRTPLGGQVNFDNLVQLKNFNWLSFLAGVVDEFDLSLQTDPITRTVYIEPTHPYAIGHDLTTAAGGYFNGNFLDWSAKQDLSKESEIESFTDSERELYFRYKDDPADGTLKKIQDRNLTKISQAKYVFPERFMAGKKTIENRFFSPTMHFVVEQWATATKPAPQMIIMVPENVSNTSRTEAQNTFQPKSAYYKGLNPNYNWVFDNEVIHPYPEMFAVNYKPGGHHDPILSYCDEVIDGVVGYGLLRRFFLQRLAIMDNGQYYKTWFKLNNNDVANFLHREFIITNGQKWELIQLDYQPLKNETTPCILKKWTPITHG